MCDPQWYIRFADISPLKIDDIRKRKEVISRSGKILPNLRIP